MSKILEEVNALASASGFIKKIKPITEWYRTVEIEKAAGYSIPCIGRLTSGESCVIDCLRAPYALVHQACLTATLFLTIKISEQLKKEEYSYSDIIQLLNNDEEMKKLMKEEVVTAEELYSWSIELQSINQRFDLKGAEETFKYQAVTFFLCSRYSPKWDYPNSDQLGDDEIDSIFNLLVKEESKNKPKTAKKGKQSAKKNWRI